MMRPSSQRGIAVRSELLVLLAIAVLAGACSSSKSTASSSSLSSTTTNANGPLVGLFKIDAGTCSSAGVTTGSWFRMVQSGGNTTSGPFLPNGDSPCGDKSWSPILPGTDGGLRTGSYQPFPQTQFDAGGNGLAASITQPTKFFAVNFSEATNSKDPQTGLSCPAPSITVSGGQLTGDLRAFGVAWNKQNFNQGAPKPDGSKAGNTSLPTGTYDPSSHHYTLQWASQIVGGPFNNFTGMWHLEGTFQPGS